MGIKGYGEAPAITYYNIPVEKMIADIEAKKSFIEKYAFTEPERYWHYLHHVFPDDNFLVCALDIAAWDLFGKMRKQRLCDLWGFDMTNAPLTNYTIGIDTLGNMLKKISDNPWPIYKIKLGTPEDIMIVRAIRERTNARIRVDANAGWSLQDAQSLVRELAQLNVEFIEQPLSKSNWEAMKLLYDNALIPFIADESCVTEDDVEKCQGYFHGINIKLIKCGGITPALRMIKQARQLHLNVMIGCMNETTVGSAAIAHLLPAVDYADVDGPLLLANDVATGLTYDNGKVKVSGRPGLGIDFHPEMT
jgi:L-alanine-DL-glutamate epimerase-like enolase superfamily enzyme